MKYGEVIKYDKVNGVYKFLIKVSGLNPKPGNFISLIFPGEMEVPLSVADYYNDTLELYIASEKLAKRIPKYVIVKGPLGRSIKLFGKVRAIAYSTYYYHILYPLRESKRLGLDVKVYCINCDTEFEKLDTPEKGDITLVSVSKEVLYKINIPLDSLVYISWIKMNCMMGVCGVCEVKGHLACLEGPFLEAKYVVDFR